MYFVWLEGVSIERLAWHDNPYHFWPKLSQEELTTKKTLSIIQTGLPRTSCIFILKLKYSTMDFIQTSLMLMSNRLFKIKTKSMPSW